MNWLLPDQGVNRAIRRGAQREMRQIGATGEEDILQRVPIAQSIAEAGSLPYDEIKRRMRINLRATRDEQRTVAGLEAATDEFDAAIDAYYDVVERYGKTRIESDVWMGVAGRVISAVRCVRRLLADQTVLDASAVDQVEEVIADAIDFDRLVTGYENLRVLREEIQRRKRSIEHAERDATHEVESPHCAEPGCKRDRVFFDEHNVGFCKRHGNERGLRPKGKVT